MKCPYCDSEVVCIDSAKIYHGRSYGKAWVCTKFPVCDSYVGCYPNTDKPLGRLANKELRAAKMEAHRVFDARWKKAVAQGSSKGAARNAAYKWLSEKLGIPPAECHIGMMDVAGCKRVVEVCK